MLVYSPDITARLQYSCQFIGMELTGIAFRLTNDRKEFAAYMNGRINYSTEKVVDDEIWISPAGLLSEEGIKQQHIECFDNNGVTAFFKTPGDLGFDLFSAIFYLLSRYEEYLPHQKDSYGRYAHENSLAFKEGFLNRPLVNQWVQLLKERISEKFPAFQFSSSTFHFLPTYDIDEAYAYKGKTSFRTAGGIVNFFLKGQWKEIGQRLRVLRNTAKDPYDAYPTMDAWHTEYKIQPVYFFLVPENRSRYDKNISPHHEEFKVIIQQHAARYKTGLHPSWQSGDEPSLLKKEKQLLESISGKEVTLSRQHYIRFTLPQTFRLLMEAGIKEDYSMGYGSINGFRASVASPFYWYDLEQEMTTDLLLFPFCYMEANSFFEQKQTATEALQEMRYYYQQVKAVNGLLITIWHNTFLGTSSLHAGWKESYETFIREINT
jgi:hypothetical protein